MAMTAEDKRIQRMLEEGSDEVPSVARFLFVVFAATVAVCAFCAGLAVGLTW